MAEVPYNNLLNGCAVYQGSLNVEYPSYGVTLNPAGPANPTQPWNPLILGSAWNVPGLCATVPSSKIIINNFQPSNKYSNEDNECIEPGSDYDITLYDPNPTYTKSLNKRQDFINKRNRSNKSKETGPFGILGYYPLYDTIEAAIYNSPTPIESKDGGDTYGYHIHNLNGKDYYMPNGLELNTNKIK